MMNIQDASISEKKREQGRAKGVIGKEGLAKGIKTFGIITAENPLSTKASSGANKHSNKSMSKELKSSGVTFIPVSGKFGSSENSYFIFNVTLDRMKSMGKRYGQSSFIFGECNESGYEATYWGLHDEDKPYQAVSNVYESKHTVTESINMSDADDFYTTIGKNFKFQFPFFDSVGVVEKFMENMSKMTDGDLSLAFGGVGLSHAVRFKCIHKGVQEIIDSTLNMKKTSKVKGSMGKVAKRPVKIKDSVITTIGPTLDGTEASEIGNGDAEAGAIEYARGLDFSEYEPEEQNIGYKEFIDSVNGIDIYYDYGADYYFFSPSKKGVSDSADEDFLKDTEGQDFEEFDKDDHEVHGKSGKHYRVVGRPGDKRHSVSWAPKEYDWDNGGEFPVEGESAKELGRRIRGVRDSKRKVKDSSAFDFYLSEDNVYDLIHEGSTSVAIPSGEDTKAFVAAVEDIIKDVAKDCGYGNIKVETEIEGNMLNIFKK